MKILVTGANRGIGLDFCRQLLAQEFGIETLVATVRDPSKAALNMMNLCYALERKDVTSVVIHPGWIQTEMGGTSAPLAPKDSLAHMLKVFQKLQSSDSGKFFNYAGAELPC